MLKNDRQNHVQFDRLHVLYFYFSSYSPLLFRLYPKQRCCFCVTSSWHVSALPVLPVLCICNEQYNKAEETATKCLFRKTLNQDRHWTLNLMSASRVALCCLLLMTTCMSDFRLKDRRIFSHSVAHLTETLHLFSFYSCNEFSVTHLFRVTTR